MVKRLTIAMDGPAGSGKSTVARSIAEALDYVYLNSGSMYRAMTLFSIQEGVDPTDEIRLIALAKRCQIEFSDNGQTTLLNGTDVSKQIRTPAIEEKIIAIARIPALRQEMVCQQRRIASEGGVVAEGRDTTTVVLPEADLKFYVTASVEERAKRRFQELQSKGIDCSEQQIAREIQERDMADQSREHSPLKMAEDAIVIDTTNLTTDEVTAFILSQIEQRSLG